MYKLCKILQNHLNLLPKSELVVYQKMYTHATEVRTVVSSIDTAFTALLSRKLRPEIFLTVGPGFPTTYNQKLKRLEKKRCITIQVTMVRNTINFELITSSHINSRTSRSLHKRLIQFYSYIFQFSNYNATRRE